MLRWIWFDSSTSKAPARSVSATASESSQPIDCQAVDKYSEVTLTADVVKRRYVEQAQELTRGDLGILLEGVQW
jgi:hypothetical protein